MTSNCTAVRIRPPGVDDNGDPIDEDPDELTIDGVTIYPGSTRDITDRGREGVVVDATILTPHGSDIVHTDQLRITDAANLDGLYAVIGGAGSFKSPFTGWRAGDEIGLKRAAG